MMIWMFIGDDDENEDVVIMKMIVTMMNMMIINNMLMNVMMMNTMMMSTVMVIDDYDHDDVYVPFRIPLFSRASSLCTTCRHF